MVEAVRDADPTTQYLRRCAPRLALDLRRLVDPRSKRCGAPADGLAPGRYVLALKRRDLRLPRAAISSRAGSKGAEWRGHSETETPARRDQRGDRGVRFGAATGCSALALWDRERAVLKLGSRSLRREAIGSTAMRQARFLFGPRSLRSRYPASTARSTRPALRLYFTTAGFRRRTRFMRRPKTARGSASRIDAIRSVRFLPADWWTLSRSSLPRIRSLRGTFDDAADAAGAALAASVKARIVATFVGTLLSGGIDSSGGRRFAAASSGVRASPSGTRGVARRTRTARVASSLGSFIRSFESAPTTHIRILADDFFDLTTSPSRFVPDPTRSSARWPETRHGGADGRRRRRTVRRIPPLLDGRHPVWRRAETLRRLPCHADRALRRGLRHRGRPPHGPQRHAGLARNRRCLAGRPGNRALDDLPAGLPSHAFAGGYVLGQALLYGTTCSYKMERASMAGRARSRFPFLAKEDSGPAGACPRSSSSGNDSAARPPKPARSPPAEGSFRPAQAGILIPRQRVAARTPGSVGQTFCRLVVVRRRPVERRPRSVGLGAHRRRARSAVNCGRSSSARRAARPSVVGPGEAEP